MLGADTASTKGVPYRSLARCTPLGRNQWRRAVDRADVAATAVEALLSPNHAGKVYTLTGPELLSVRDQAAILAAALGRDVEVTDLPPDEARRQMLASGMNRDAVEAMSHGMSYVRGGHNAVVTDHVDQLLGHPPTTFATGYATTSRPSHLAVLSFPPERGGFHDAAWSDSRFSRVCSLADDVRFS